MTTLAEAVRASDQVIEGPGLPLVARLYRQGRYQRASVDPRHAGVALTYLAEAAEWRQKAVLRQRMIEDLTRERDALLVEPAAPTEPEWIDDPHDIEQGMMRNPKWKPAATGSSLRIDFRQATGLLAMFGGEPAEITLASSSGSHVEHSGPGLYAWHTDYPEEGSIHLGVTDEEAMPEPAAPQEEPSNAISVIDEWMHVQTLKLRTGEMSAQEVRTVLAVLGAVRRQIAAYNVDRAVLRSRAPAAVPDPDHYVVDGDAELRDYKQLDPTVEDQIAITKLWTEDQIRSLWQTTDTGDADDDIMSFAHALIDMVQTNPVIALQRLHDWAQAQSPDTFYGGDHPIALAREALR